MTKINGAYVFFGLFVVIIIGLGITGNLFNKPKKWPKPEYPTEGGKRKRKPRRKHRR